jgi:hypothetical protein
MKIEIELNEVVDTDDYVPLSEGVFNGSPYEIIRSGGINPVVAIRREGRLLGFAEKDLFALLIAARESCENKSTNEKEN